MRQLWKKWHRKSLRNKNKVNLLLQRHIGRWWYKVFLNPKKLPIKWNKSDQEVIIKDSKLYINNICTLKQRRIQLDLNNRKIMNQKKNKWEDFLECMICIKRHQMQKIKNWLRIISYLGHWLWQVHFSCRNCICFSVWGILLRIKRIILMKF